VENTLLWLRDIKLAQYSRAFKENDVDGQTLTELNERDLRDLGIRSIGHRKTFMRHLAEAKKFIAEEVGSDEASPALKYQKRSNNATEFEQPAAKYQSNNVSEFERPKEHGYNSVIIRGMPERVLEDEDTLFDIENLAFTGFSVDSFQPTGEGIIVTFENPLSFAKKDEVKEKFVEVMERLLDSSQLMGPLIFDFWENGNIVERSPEPPRVENKKRKIIEEEIKEPTPPPPPKRMNYWKEFWVKLITNGDAEDFFDDEETKLNARAAREVLATIRDVRLKEIKKDDPGIKYLKGFTQAEIEATLSDCLLDVMYEIENREPEVEADIIPKEESPKLKPENGIYVGMSVEGLPRVITDVDETVSRIQSVVFKDVAVKRLIVLDDKNPPALKVEFEKYITKEKIPKLARNLKNFLKDVNVDQEALNDVTIAFLEPGFQPPPKPVTQQREGRQTHTRRETDDFLVRPGDTVELTRTFMIEGIPERYIKQDGFLQDMPERVFDGVPLRGISIPPATKQSDGSMSQTSLEIQFEKALNIQKLPKIAMKLKKFLKRKQIPPRIVNQVTLQVRHEENGPPLSELEANPVVGLIFKGIPKRILESNESLYSMESNVFTGKHPIRLMEPNEADEMLRITIENPICHQQDLTTIAQRLKRFLGSQGVSSKAINDVLVMSFNKEKWQQDQTTDNAPKFSANDYIGIEIENMPASIVDSDQQLEDIERQVFAKQQVVHMNVLDTTLRITFGVAADSKGIERVARQLKSFLSKKNIPLKQINDIIIEPHTKSTWDRP